MGFMSLGVVLAKKLDYKSIAEKRGLNFLREENRRVLIEDEFGLSHSFGFYSFSKGASPNIRSALKEYKTQYYVASIIKAHPKIVEKTDFKHFAFIGTNSSSRFVCKNMGSILHHPHTYYKGVISARSVQPTLLCQRQQ